MTATVLLVDDEPTALSFIGAMLRDFGYEVKEAGTLAQAHQVIEKGEADIVVLDVQLPDGYGPNFLEQLGREHPTIPVILVTGFGDIEMAVAAMKAGAVDFVQKPVDIERLRQGLDRAAQAVALRRELERLRSTAHPAVDWVIGETPAMQRLYADLTRVARTHSRVLITGESGTGKELLARALYRLSPRADRPYFPVNCATFTAALLESELFGHEAGAFTDAKKKKDGLFVVADGGTLFLDEISLLEPSLQSHLLRTLAEGTVRRLGGTSEIKVDVRIISATNENVSEMIRQKRFREDLFHRLNTFELHLPALRERREDIPALVGHFVQRFNRELGRNVQGLGPYVLETLLKYDWPGNIRELENTIERAMIFADGDTITVDALRLDLSPLPV